MRIHRLFLLTIVALITSACASSPRPQGFVTPPADAFASAYRVQRKAEVPKHVVMKEPWLSPGLSFVNTEVTLDVLMGEEGAVTGSRYVSGDKRFFPDTAAAAQLWRFEPLLVNGEAVAFVVPVRFAMKWRVNPPGADIRISYALAE